MRLDEPRQRGHTPPVAAAGYRNAGWFCGQAFGTGPTVRFSAMPEMFESIMHAARSELLISTPYFVPSESMLEALCACAYRGVKPRLFSPAKTTPGSLVRRAGVTTRPCLMPVSPYEYVGGFAAHQVTDHRRRGFADRLRQYGPTQFRP